MQARAPLNDDEKRRLILGLVARLSCAGCGRLYDPEDFGPVHRWQDVWVLSARCRQCDDTCHVVVYMRLDADPAMELPSEEAKAVSKLPPITADDVLDVHMLLREFEGDFRELFAI